MTQIEDGRQAVRRGFLLTAASSLLLMLSQCGPPAAQGQQPINPRCPACYGNSCPLAGPGSWLTPGACPCAAGQCGMAGCPGLAVGPASTFVYYPVGNAGDGYQLGWACTAGEGGNCSEMYASPPMQRWGGRRFHLFGRRCR